MLGDTTSFLKPRILSSRFLHFGSWAPSNDGDDVRSISFSSNEELERGLEKSDSASAESGDDERGEYARARRRRSNMRYCVLRFTHVPPKSSVTTTSGSMKVPTPIVNIRRRMASSGEVAPVFNRDWRLSMNMHLINWRRSYFSAPRMCRVRRIPYGFRRGPRWAAPG